MVWTYLKKMDKHKIPERLLEMKWKKTHGQTMHMMGRSSHERGREERRGHGG
jgi:hypothetical protein